MDKLSPQIETTNSGKTRRDPRKISKERYDELIVPILGQFWESYRLNAQQFSEKELRMEISGILSRGFESNGGTTVGQRAKAQLANAAGISANMSMEDKRRSALQELIFKHEGDKVNLAVFLRRLLRKDKMIADRERHLERALVNINTMARMSVASEKFCFKWPEVGRFMAADAEPDEVALRIAELQKARLEAGVDIELAMVFGPLIIAWREFWSSPKTRGSKAHDSAEKRILRRPQKSV